MKLLNKILLSGISSLFLITPSVMAAWIDNFEVTLTPDSAKAWEYLDFAIEAKDKNNQTVTDYEGMVLIFSESDPEAELPLALEENTYTFQPSDQWKVMFENSVKFLNEWNQNIYVYDFNDDTVFGIWEVSITWWSETSDADIDIISPENWLTIWEQSIKVSGSTNKNHRVIITLNWTEEFETTTNSNWIYEKEITWLTDWENTIKSRVLDWDENIIWESQEVKIKVETNNITLKNIKTTPEEVDAWWAYEIEVISNEWLRDISIVINDVVNSLEDKWEWVYTAKSYAPEEEWVYNVDVILKNEIWHEKKELWAYSLTVNKVEELNSAEPVVEEEEVIEEGPDLSIKNLKLVTLKSKSVLTWDEVDEALNYNVYKENKDWELELFSNVEEPRFEIEITWEEVKYENFYVKAVTEDDNWEPYEGALSDATKVKTWPELILLLLISLLLPIIYFVIKQRRA